MEAMREECVAALVEARDAARREPVERAHWAARDVVTI
jgi:hypothetical protein